MHVWNSSYDRYGDESRAFAEAWATVQKAETLDANETPEFPTFTRIYKAAYGPANSPKDHAALARAQTAETAMTDNFSFFLPIAKIDEAKRTISGYASTEAKDSDGEVVSLEAIKAALPDYMSYGNIREMHRLSAVGTAEEAHVDRKGLFLKARISDDSAWQKVVDKVYKGFSIGGRKLAKVADKITELAMTEISIVDRPANPECKFEIAKMDKTGAVTFEPGAVLQKSKRSKEQQLARSFATVSEFLLKAADGSPPFEKPTQDPNDSANSPKCAAHGEVGCPTCMCKKHGAMDCEKCAAKRAKKIAKREFNAQARRDAAASGDAMPDGSFPIKNQKDLDNAVGLRGNSSHPKSAVEAHIRAMATKHGLTLPDSMSAKPKATRKAVSAATLPSFLNLKPAEEDVAGVILGRSGARLELGKPRKGGAERTEIRKGMRTAGSLSYCFDNIRDAARSLLMESKLEGGDQKDKGLAKQLGSAAQILATVIGQKATHEGQEALDFSDGDDRFIRDLLGEDFDMTKMADGLNNTALAGDPLGTAILDVIKRAAAPTRAMRMKAARDNLKKLRKARKTAAGAIEDVHKMLKAAYIAKMEKAAKKPKDDDGDDDFDSTGAMDKLAAAYAELGKVSTFAKAAGAQLKKMASRSGQHEQEPSHGNAHYEVPPGVRDRSVREIATASPGGTTSGSEPPLQALDKEWAGKLAKAVGKDGRVDAGVVIQMIENERLRSENEMLTRSISRNVGSPTSRAPYSFDLTKVAGNGGADRPRNGNEALAKAVRDSGVNVASLETDERARGAVIGTYMLDGNNGKSVLDPSFRGTAGLSRR